MSNKRKLKNWVTITLLVVGITGIIGISSVISNTIFKSLTGDNYSYVMRGLADDEIPVAKEIKNMIARPYDSKLVKEYIGFYENNASKESQEKALIFYENTYMPNSGILYSSTEQFDVLSVYEGEVVSIKDDKIFGKIIEIKHNGDLTTRYSSIDSLEVKEGDTVNCGEVLGKSSKNKISSESQNMLLFEVIYQGQNINPNNCYEKTLIELGN